MAAKDIHTDTSREKMDEDDHDLLTFGEAGERLRLETDEAVALVKRLEEQQCSASKLQKAVARLDALRAAAGRNSAQPINDANFERFFGYPGVAKRNLPGPSSDQI
jgi:hypothetical protein